MRAALLLLGFLLVPVAFPLVWFVLGDCKGQDRTAGGVFWAPAVYVAYFVGRMVGRLET